MIYNQNRSNAKQRKGLQHYKTKWQRGGVNFCYMNIQNFYKSTRWKKKRRAILRRDKYMCQECARYGRKVERREVHHIKFLEEYPELAFDNDNLISLCHACHNAKHPEKAKKATASRHPPSF